MEGGKNFVKEFKDFQIKCTLTENSVTINGKHKRKEFIFGGIIKSGSFPPSFTNLFDYLHQIYTFLESCKQQDISIEGNLMCVSTIVGPLGKPKKLEIPIKSKPFGKEEKTESEIDQLKERVSKLEEILENSITGVIQTYLNKTIRKKMDDFELKIKFLAEKILNNTLKVNNLKEVQDDKKVDELTRTPVTKKKSSEVMLMSTTDPLSKLNMIRQASTEQHLIKPQKSIPQHLKRPQKSVHQRQDKQQKSIPLNLDKQSKTVPLSLYKPQIVPQNLSNSQKQVRNQSFNGSFPNESEIVQEGQLPVNIIKDLRLRDFVFQVDLTNPNLQSFIVNKNFVTKRIDDGKLYQVYSLNPISDRHRQSIYFKFTKVTENSSAAFGLISEDKKLLQYIYQEKGTISMGCDKGYELYVDGSPQNLMLNKIKDNVVMELQIELRTNKIRFYRNGDHQQPVAKLVLPQSMRNKKLYPFFQLHDQGDSVELFNS